MTPPVKKATNNLLKEPYTYALAAMVANHIIEATEPPKWVRLLSALTLIGTGIASITHSIRKISKERN